MPNSNPTAAYHKEIRNDRPATLALIGGFLGAGKTTLIGRTVQYLQGYGLRCAVVSNDQSVGLVDGVSAKLLGGAAVGEVTGACFCCKLDDLVQVVERLQREDRPDVILCEPVGSCTDLMATVILPLERIYKTGVRLTRFTVLLDARRALSTYGGARKKKDFSKDVGYIFRKQVEEADCLFLNKADLLSDEDRRQVRAALAKEFPGKTVFEGAAKSGDGVAAWISEVIGLTAGETDHTLVSGREETGGKADSLVATLMERRCNRPVEVDYGVYARGEAMLGWYNAELSFRVEAPVDGNGWLLAQAIEISGNLEAEGCEVAHFKMSLENTEDGKNPCGRDNAEGRVAIVNQVMSGEGPALSREMDGALKEGILLVNLRAEGDATLLKTLVRNVLERKHDVSLGWTNEAAFQPGEPKPTHRILAEAL